jgi:hypothetical protein
MEPSWAFGYIPTSFTASSQYAHEFFLGVPHLLDRDDVYEGYHLPKGSIVIPNIWCVAKLSCICDWLPSIVHFFLGLCYTTQTFFQSLPSLNLSAISTMRRQLAWCTTFLALEGGKLLDLQVSSTLQHIAVLAPVLISQSHQYLSPWLQSLRLAVFLKLSMRLVHW